MSKLSYLYYSWQRTGVRYAKVRCSQCGHYCDIHSMRILPSPPGLDATDAVVCEQCHKILCSFCLIEFGHAYLTDKCPHCGGHIRKVPIWREKVMVHANENRISYIWLLRLLSLALMISGLFVFGNLNTILGLILMFSGFILGAHLMHDS